MNAATKNEIIEVSQANIATLPPAARAAVVLKSEQTRKELAELVKQSAGIVAISNKDGREEAHRAAMVLRSTRVAIKNAGETAREDAVAFSKAVIKEAGDLVSIIEPEEKRVLGLRDQWDEKIEAEKQAKIAAERARVEKIRTTIDNIASAPVRHLSSDSSKLATAIQFYEVIPIRADEYAEFAGEAENTRAATLEKLREMHAKAAEAEAAALAAEEARKAEAARIEAERAELARLREEQAERERLAKIESDRIAAEQAAEGKRIADRMAAEQAALQAERDRIAAEQARAAAELKAAQERLEADRAAHEARLQLESDHAEALELNAHFDLAREAERARLQALADQLLADNRLSLPESVTVRDALIDDGIDDLNPTDEEIAAMGKEFGLTPDAWIERLEAFCGKMRAVTSTGQYYSKTTFKENGAALFLNADGSRSIFCDVDD